MKTATLTVMLLLLTGVAAAQSIELEFRLYDVSAITEHRMHNYGTLLGFRGTFHDYSEREEVEPSQFLSVDALADYIREAVEVSSWDTGGDVMGMEGGLLLVKNRPAVHKKVQEFLNQMAAAASQRIAFEVELYELDDSRYPNLIADQVPKADAEKADLNVSLVESASGEAWPGITTAIQVTNQVRFVVDYDVEIAQGSNIADPVVDLAVEGTVVEMIARPTVDGSRLVIDTIVSHGKFQRPFRTLMLGIDEEYIAEPYRSQKRNPLGKLQLPVFDHLVAATTRIVPAGGTFTLPIVSGGKTFLFKVKTRILGSTMPDNILSTAALCHRPEQVGFGFLEDELEGAEKALVAPKLQRSGNHLPPFFPGPEELLDFIVQNVAPWYWEEEGSRMGITERHDIVVGASDDILKAVRKFVIDLETQQLRQVHFDLRVLSTAKAMAPGVRDAFPEGTPLYAGTVSTLPGRSTSFQAGNTMNYLADYDVEVAQEARISDPIIGQSFAGLIANLSPNLSLDGEQVVTKVKLRLTHREHEEIFDTGALFLGPIDRVSQARTTIETTVTIPTGRVFVLDAGMNPKRPDERLVVAIKASKR